jgi:hypothetical protein
MQKKLFWQLALQPGKSPSVPTKQRSAPLTIAWTVARLAPS